jgi:tRNA pseudouridine(38-40) synthase
MIGIAAGSSSKSIMAVALMTAVAVVALCITSVEGLMALTPSSRRKGVSCAAHQHPCEKQSDQNEKNKDWLETRSEQQMRQFWELEPFDTVQRMVRAMVTQQPSAAEIPSFRVVQDKENENDDDTDSVNQNADEHDDNDNIFTKFYMGRSCEIVEDCNAEASPPTWQRRRGPQESQYNSFRLDLCYVGPSFCGWQRQPPAQQLPSVQQVVEDTLAAAWKQRSVNVRCSGRTDAGVNAVGQVARVRTRDRAVTARDVLAALETGTASVDNSVNNSNNNSNNNSWRCWRVSSVPDSFHPTFGTQSRSYVYMMDAASMAAAAADVDTNKNHASLHVPTLVHLLNSLLQPLQGRALDYVGMSYGKVKTENTNCTLYHARAVQLVETTTTTTTTATTMSRHDKAPGMAIAIELTGDRFLRRMVRILVATAMVLALDDQEDGNNNSNNAQDRLLQLVQAQDRRLSAKAAPPTGLVFVGAHMADDDEDDENNDDAVSTAERDLRV